VRQLLFDVAEIAEVWCVRGDVGGVGDSDRVFRMPLGRRRDRRIACHVAQRRGP
jgi:hypothetical protein